MTRNTRIVFIGSRGDVHGERLQARLAESFDNRPPYSDGGSAENF